jgi:hypothetical protein
MIRKVNSNNTNNIRSLLYSNVTMAANRDSKLSTITHSTEAALPVVDVFITSDGVRVSVKWGVGGAQQTVAGLSDYYSDSFHATDSEGIEPFRETFGSLLGCNDGTLTIGEDKYRIQVQLRRQDLAQQPPTTSSTTPTSRRPRSWLVADAKTMMPLSWILVNTPTA